MTTTTTTTTGEALRRHTARCRTITQPISTMRTRVLGNSRFGWCSMLLRRQTVRLAHAGISRMPACALASIC